jgi:hypothetical protein
MPGGKRSKVEEGVTVATLASVSIIVISSARPSKTRNAKTKGRFEGRECSGRRKSRSRSPTVSGGPAHSESSKIEV